MADPVSLRLTQTELYLLKRLFGIEVLPGVAPDLLVGLNGEQRLLAAKLTEQAQRARLFVNQGNEVPDTVDPAIVKFLCDYARPRWTLFVETILPEGRGTSVLYVFGERSIYEQSQPESDSVQFRLLADHDMVVQQLFPQIEEERLVAPERWQGHILQGQFNNAIRLAQQDERAATLLFATTLSSELAKTLAASYHRPRVIQYLASWQRVPTQGAPEPRAALTILQGAEHTFLLWVEHPELGNKAFVRIHPFFTVALRNYLEYVVPPFPTQAAFECNSTNATS